MARVRIRRCTFLAPVKLWFFAVDLPRRGREYCSEKFRYSFNLAYFRAILFQQITGVYKEIDLLSFGQIG